MLNTPDRDGGKTRDLVSESSQSLATVMKFLESELATRMPAGASKGSHHIDISPVAGISSASIRSIPNTSDHTIELIPTIPNRLNWSVRMAMNNGPKQFDGVPFKVTELSLTTKHSANGWQIEVELYGAGKYVLTHFTEDDLAMGAPAYAMPSVWHGEKQVLRASEKSSSEENPNVAIIRAVMNFITSNFQRGQVSEIMAGTK